MSLFRVKLELRSSLVTPLASDTLWGHLAWGIRWRDGETALTAWLDAYDTGNPPLVISDPMPAGYLPVPALPAAPPPVETCTAEVFEQRKGLNKRAWMSHDAWVALRSQLDRPNLDAHLGRDSAPPGFSHATVVHAAINRLTGSTVQEGGGTLFAVDRHYPLPDGRQFDVWCSMPDGDTDSLRSLFEMALVGGYGRDGASGLGHLVVLDVERTELPGSQSPANAAMLLGFASPGVNDPARGFLRHCLRAGRLGGGFASGPTPDGSHQPNKRPVHGLRRGTILLANPAPLTVGRLVGNVHPFAPIRHGAITLAIPCRIAQDLVEAAA